MSGIIGLVKKLLYRFPQKYILFESSPDFGDNTKAVFDEIQARDSFKKYKFVWVSYDKGRSYPKIKGTRFYKRDDIRLKLILPRAKAVVCCNHLIRSDNPKAVNFYLGHGNPIKNASDYFSTISSYDYIVASSQGMKEIRNKIYGIDNDKMVALGYPRNDVLTAPPVDLHRFFKQDFEKVIVWYPTFRQHKKGALTGCEHALPVIWDEERAARINRCARENNVLIVLKPHFAQDVSFIKQMDLSNLVFIDDKFFSDNGLTSYRFVGSCNALLTDYSSIYYDYTLCDKPIGLTWEDYDDYNKNPGFVVDMDKMMKGGVKIYEEEDLIKFINDVSKGIDILRDERREIRDFANISTDGSSAKRVVDFIEEKIR